MKRMMVIAAAVAGSLAIAQQWRIEESWSDAVPGLAPWSYGFRASEAGADLSPMAVYMVMNIGGVQVPIWRRLTSGYTQVGFNPSNSTANGGEGTLIPPHSIHMHPHANLATVIRFAAPEAGTYSYGFRWMRQGWTGSVTYSVVRSGVSEYTGRISLPHVLGPWTVSAPVSLSGGGAIDFAISQDGLADWDSTGLYAFVLRHGAAVPIEVQVDLADTSGSLARPASWQLRMDGAVVDSGETALDASGLLQAGSTLRGQYELVVKADHWLAKSLGLVQIGDSGVSGLTASLANGDIDGDNAVTVFDYNALSDAFDTVAGDQGWNELADLDGDEAVTVFDYNVLSANFDLTGD